MKLREMTHAELLALYVQIREEFRARDILRSENSLTSDLAEYLFCSVFRWKQEPNSRSGYDATNDLGRRYQIKGRWMHRRTKSRQLSPLRNLEQHPFDMLAGILFADDYRVLQAALIPWAVVCEHARYSAHINGHIFHLRDEVWSLDGVQDVTDRFVDNPRWQPWSRPA